jgi:hypothetical protein
MYSQAACPGPVISARINPATTAAPTAHQNAFQGPPDCDPFPLDCGMLAATVLTDLLGGRGAKLSLVSGD